MPVNLFVSNHLVKCRPINTFLDFKKSSYKKALVFLTFLAQKELIVLSEEQPGVWVILEINRSDPLLRSFTEHETEPEEVVQAEEATGQLEPISLVGQYWRFGKTLGVLLPDPSVKRDFSVSEATNVLFNYISTSNLTVPASPNLVTLNTQLINALYNKSDNVHPGDKVEKKQLAERLKARLLPVHELMINGRQEIRKGLPPTVTLSVESRVGRKMVTVVHGLSCYGVNEELLCNHFSKMFAASASVHESKKGKGTEILVQGDRQKQVERYLADSLSIPPKFISIAGSKTGGGRGRGKK
eukprot:TRINITY_DN10273_c1_g1_i4.p1 TRINITY_DN10273_c1_g1~~TRINITY_DN10273_c1_g1_i4.p1  ORF type:complete len:329 (-),score=79.03 TRINITY_DN10273_c1_g1_i4:38-934(-)